MKKDGCTIGYATRSIKCTRYQSASACECAFNKKREADYLNDKKQNAAIFLLFTFELKYSVRMF